MRLMVVLHRLPRLPELEI